MPTTIQLSEDIRIRTFDNSDSLSDPIQAALDIVGDAYGVEATWVAVPSHLLPGTFFDLSTRIAGEFMQKLVNYHVKVAIVGDISTHLAASNAFRSFVSETNRGAALWFVPDDATLHERLVSASGLGAQRRLNGCKILRTQ